MTIAKAFAFPNKVLGEAARLNLQINAYNVFNTLNLDRTPGQRGNGNFISPDGINSNPAFGQVGGALAGRIVELQARFSY